MDFKNLLPLCLTGKPKAPISKTLCLCCLLKSIKYLPISLRASIHELNSFLLINNHEKERFEYSIQATFLPSTKSIALFKFSENQSVRLSCGLKLIQSILGSTSKQSRFPPPLLDLAPTPPRYTRAQRLATAGLI